jgi:sec-independent protein translocase protein TatA
VLSPIEIILIVLIVIFLFGASRLPKIGRNLGQGLRGFKHELSGGLQDEEEAKDRELVPREIDPEAVPRAPEAVPRAYERH